MIEMNTIVTNMYRIDYGLMCLCKILNTVIDNIYIVDKEMFDSQIQYRCSLISDTC